MAVLGQGFQHLLVAVPDRQAADDGRVGVELAVVADRVGDFQAVFQTGDVVVMAVAGRDVDQADAGFGGDEVGQDHRHLVVVERMLQRRPSSAAPGICATVSTASKP
jgi:hypothetical protein